jgi:signal transduction histidine kinase
VDEGSRSTGSGRARIEPELETLNRLGLALASHLDTERLVKAVTDAGLAITGAVYGAFLYKNAAGHAARYVAGVPDGFPELPASPAADSFERGFLAAVCRSDHLSADSRCVPGTPFVDMPTGLLPAKSCLAAPVRSPLGALLGGLFFAHTDASFFDERDERMLEGLAAHAAIALDNAQLYREAQEARASAEAANGLKDAFLATLSHELRTPLTAISGWAHLLQRGKLSPEEAARAVETIIRNANAQAQVIDGLLDVSSIITGKFQLDLQSLVIGAVVQAAIVAVTPAASAKGIQLELIQSPALEWVMGDAERLQQVFWNLLSNAIKFTDKDGRVRVRIERVDDHVRVVVADNGVGIDASFLPRVFDRFTQDDSSSTRRTGGLGLGLSIARQLAELQGGSIDAQSPGPGRGSTFTASFPTTLGRAS